MALTTLAMRNDVWMDGVAVAGQDLRLQQASAFLTGASPSGTTGIAARPGVRYGTGNPLGVTASSGMVLGVAAGIAWAQGSAAANAGMYTGCLDTAGTVQLATSDPTNPRIDNIIVQVIDLGTSGSTTFVTPQTGTPASSPVAPTLPANSLLLAQVAVGAGVTTISSGNITDKRVYTSAYGGITPLANVTGGFTGPAGLYAHDISTGRLKVSDGAGNARQAKTAAFAPALLWSTSSASVSSASFTNIILQSVTVDGATEVELRVGWAGIQAAAAAAIGDQVTLQLIMDGAVFPPIAPQEWFYRQDSTSTAMGGGGSLVGWATPSNGSHTFGLQAARSLGTNSYNVLNPYIRINASFS